MRTIRLTNFWFALFCLFLSNSIAAGQAAAQNQPTQVREGFCQAQDQGTIYFSDVFEINLPYNVIANGSIENLFEAYLKQSYGRISDPGIPVVCDFLLSVAAAEEMKKQKHEGYTMRGKQLVETRWKLSRQQAAALPTPKLCALSHGEFGPCPVTSDFRKSYCYSDPSNPTIYFSDIFDTNIPVGTSGSNKPTEAAFYAYLKQAHAYKSTSGFLAQCVQFDSVAAAEASKQQLQGPYKNGNYRIVETRWKQSSQQANTAPPPASGAPSAVVANAPASAAPGASAAVNPNVTGQTAAYSFCWASMGGNEYFSAPFAGAKETSRSWVYAFAEYLKQKYDYKGFAQCPTTQSLAEAQAQLQKLVDNARSQGFKYVETGWVYTTAANPPASPASADAVSSSHAPTTTSHNATSQPGAAAGAGAPPSLYGLCYASYDPHTAYFSAPFKVTNGNYSQWQQAFATFLQKNYDYGAVVGCYREGSLAAAQRDLKTLEGTFRPTRKIIETGWEYR